MDKYLNTLFGIFIFQNVIDLFLTAKAVKLGAVEINPLFTDYATNHFWVLIVGKIIVTVLLYLWMLHLEKRSYQKTNDVLYGLNGAMMVVILSNLWTMYYLVSK